jgi:methylenetetrahydrofolate dehydrogenase (NADP+)/methenyltetrahydrofolate cyclohydrolase
MSEVEKLNADPEVDGIIVQLPIPKHLDEKAVINAIDPNKDADGFHPMSVGKMVLGEETYLPCTPHGVMVLLKREGIDISGKEAVVVGRSNIVGKPVSMMLLQENATVTICHSKTADLVDHIRKADVLVVAIGRPEFVKGEWVKEGAIVVDVGINRVDDKWVGDVEYAPAAERASAITPVPGGVGPMTRAMLLENTVKAARARASRS